MRHLGIILLSIGLLSIPVTKTYAGIVKVADNEVDESYDPFADYSEFDQTSEEEADINFFRNGRFFTLGIVAGYQFVTSQMSELYQGAPAYGLYLSYFFDLRFALQVGYLSSNHPVSYTSPAGTGVSGSATIGDLSLSLKYYINTQNVTRGLAALNPYIIGGYALISRTTTLSGVEAFGKDQSNSVHLGAGIEVPILKNKMYVGGQVVYELLNFSNENQQVFLQNGTEPTGLYPKGDFITALAILGVNF